MTDNEAVTYEDYYGQKYDGLSIGELAKAMQSLKKQHDNLKSQGAKLWHEYDYLRMKAIVKAMQDMEIETVKLKGIGRISIRDEMGCKTVNKDGLMDWFNQHDLGDMIQQTINYSTLKAFIREQIRQGNEIPGDDLIEVKPYNVASITKS